MAGLGVDVGYLHYQKEQMQKAADAAAIAGASALVYGGNYIAAAKRDSAANGFVDGVDNVTVTVNNPPQTSGDPFRGNTNDVEVIVAQPRPTFFMKVVGYDLVNVRSRAVASSVGNASGCVYALDPTGDSGTLIVHESVTLTTTCAIYVNSTSSTALIKTGSGGVIASATGDGIGVVGNYTGEGFVPTPVTGIPQFTDPLATLKAPAVPNCQYPGGLITISKTLPAGSYCGPITIIGDEIRVTFGGTYFLAGGLTVIGHPKLIGNGVTFYNTKQPGFSYGPITMRGSPDTNLSAPTTGPMAGILVFQDRSITDHSSLSFFDSSNGATFTGAIYLPTTTLRFKGIPALGSYSPLVAWNIHISGTSNIKNNWLPPTGAGSPIPGAVLVE